MIERVRVREKDRQERWMGRMVGWDGWMDWDGLELEGLNAVAEIKKRNDCPFCEVKFALRL